MALNKSDLLSLISQELPDNATESITASDLRTVLSQMVDSDLNLLEPTETAAISNRVIINQASDLANYLVGLVYVLPANTQYYIGSSISVDYRFDLSAGNIVILGESYVSSITYNGTGDMFFGENVGGVSLSGLTLSQPNAGIGDAIYNFSDTGSASSVVNLSNTSILSCHTIFNIENIRGLTIDLFSVLSASNGGVVSGTGTSVLSINKIGILTTSAAFVGIDFGTNVFTSLEIMNMQIFGVAGSVGIKGLANSANMLSGFVGQISSCEFLGGMTPLDTITGNDFRFFFSANSGIIDTYPDALISMDANATNTVISAVDTPTLIAGTWVLDSASHFVTTSAGRITYLGEKPIRSPIDIVVDMEPVSGTNKDLRVCVAINGVGIPASCRLARIDSANPQSLAAVWQHNFVNGDYLEAFVENTTDATNILVSGAVLRVR